MAGQKPGIFVENRFLGPHALVHYQMELLFTGVLNGADFLKASDSEQELIDILNPSPLSIAHDIQPRLLLKTNGKQDHVVHHLPESLLGHLVSPCMEAPHHLGPG